jgi:hypothetical protein
MSKGDLIIGHLVNPSCSIMLKVCAETHEEIDQRHAVFRAHARFDNLISAGAFQNQLRESL